MNSLSYLAVLHTLCIPVLTEPREILLEKIVIFLLSFDARQLRYAGSHLLDILTLVGNGHLLPVSSSSRMLPTIFADFHVSGLNSSRSYRDSHPPN